MLSQFLTLISAPDVRAWLHEVAPYILGAIALTVMVVAMLAVVLALIAVIVIVVHLS